MNNTLGERIAEKRKEKKLTQEGLAEKLGISSQAVSKWENDQSYPDIMLLPKLAEILGVSVDELLGVTPKDEVKIVPEEKRKKLEEMVLHVIVNSSDGDKIRVNLPMGIIKMVLNCGISDMLGIKGKNEELLRSIDFQSILNMVANGMVGKLVEVESAEGDFVEITVE